MDTICLDTVLKAVKNFDTVMNENFRRLFILPSIPNMNFDGFKFGKKKSYKTFKK